MNQGEKMNRKIEVTCPHAFRLPGGAIRCEYGGCCIHKRPNPFGPFAVCLAPNGTQQPQQVKR